MTAPRVSFGLFEEDCTLGVQWSHPLGDLAGYEVRYGADGNCNNRIAFKLTRPSRDASSWIAYLREVDVRSSVSARVRVRFQNNDWSEWSETAVWIPEKRTTHRSTSRTVTPPTFRLGSPKLPPMLPECADCRQCTPAALGRGRTSGGRGVSVPSSRDGYRQSPATDAHYMRTQDASPFSRASTPTPQKRTPMRARSRDIATAPPVMPTASHLPGRPKVTTPTQKYRPQTLEFALPGGVPYVPHPQSVLVIAPGAPWVWDYIPEQGQASSPARWSVNALEDAGYDVTVVWNNDYDVYPKGWRTGQPDLKSNGGKNHSTLADDFIVPKLKELVSAGRGPSVILAGSRGGQCTLPRLWQLGWRGGAVCVNAGCATLTTLPRDCRLTLVTGGLDFFKQSADPELARQMRRKDPKTPVLLYHDPHMGHTGAPDDFERTGGHHLLLSYVLKHLVDMTSAGHERWCAAHRKGATVDGPWPSGAHLEVV